MKKIPLYTHTDFSKYYLHFAIQNKSDKLNKKRLLKKMLNELLELTNKFLIIPTYNYSFGKNKIYNINKDISQVGSFSEYFRKKYKKNRTLVPFYSDCSNLDLNKYFIKKDLVTPFGENSIFDLLYKKKGKIVFFGSEFSPTYIHFIESQIFEKIIYRFYKKFSGKIHFNKKKRKILLKMHVIPRRIKINYDLLKIKNDLIKNNILKTKKTKSNFYYSLFDVRNFHDFCMKKISKNSFYFLTSDSRKQIEKFYF
mgnify:FL=1